MTTDTGRRYPMKKLTHFAIAALLTVGSQACDAGGTEEESVRFNLLRDEGTVRLEFGAEGSEDGCTAVSILPDDGMAILRNLCADDQRVATVNLSDDLAEQFAAAADMESGVADGEFVGTDVASGRLVDVPMTADLEEALEEVFELHAQHGESQPGGYSQEEGAPDAPAQTGVALAMDMGAVFATDAVVDADPTKTDLVAYAGFAVIFNDLHELPNVALSGADHDLVRNVRAGMGFVVENNVSGGVTYVWVKQASATKVELAYQLVD
jgi:hypothetical protein